MQDNQLFEYAVIRVVPKVEREEFVNVGVILYCAQQRFLKVLFTLDEERLKSFSGHLNIDEVKEHLHAFGQISAGGISAGPVGRLDIASRFRWLTATRSTVVQSSRVHPGLCTDASVTLIRLHQQLVLC
jgi:hypothetical protein